MKTKDIKYLVFLTLLILLVFRGLMTNLATALPDWRDHVSAAWVINQNIKYFKILDFTSIYNTNSFYPYTNTLFLSETFFTQSVIGLIFSFFTSSPIAIYNLVFITTF